MTFNEQEGVDTVVFDLDGTLADTAPDIADALNLVLSDAGLPVFDLATITSMVGGGARTLVERAVLRAAGTVDERLTSRLYERFLAAYDAAPSVKSRLYPGVRAALEGLKARRLKLGVCTNKPELLTGIVLRGLGVESYFGAVVGGSMRLSLKPAPDMLLKAIQDLGSAPERSLMVGDSVADVGAARAAGVPVAVFSGGYCAGPITDLRADMVFDDYSRFFASGRAA